MFYSLSEEELRAYCRTSIESLEMWARRLIHGKMVEKYGENYINHQISDGNYCIRKGVRKRIQSLSKNEPQRIQRPVDASYLKDLIDILCDPKLYEELFKEALDFSYPQGKDEVRIFLERLIPIRNALSHTHSISVRQAEQAICYSHDFVEGLKDYYKEKGEEQVWNVPRIIRISDSFGNVFENPTDSDEQFSAFNISKPLYCGETYSVTVEVDSTFSHSSYDIIWIDAGNKMENFTNKATYSVSFSEKDVSAVHIIECKTISHKEWHKFRNYDCHVVLLLKV